jgi:DNA adenine methylase
MSFLKWMGGKSQVVHLFKDYFPNINNCKGYIEPFIGGGSVFFYVKQNYDLTGKPVYVSDINGELINCYRCVRDNVNDIIPLLKVHEKLNGEKGEEYYYEIRDRYPPGNGMTNVEKAAAFIYLSKAAFGGMWRVNSEGRMNTSYSGNLNLKVVDNDLRYYSRLLKDVKIIHSSFEKILQLKNIDGYFCYWDPPYYELGDKTAFTGYSKDGYHFTIRELLPRTFKELNKRGCKVMMSNSNVQIVRDYFKEFNIHVIQTDRNKGVRLSNITKDKLEGAKKLSEVVVTNYKHVKRQCTMSDYE